MTADHPVRPWYVCNGDPCRCAKPKTLAPEPSAAEQAEIDRFGIFDAEETVERVARAIASGAIAVPLVTDDEWDFYLRPDQQERYRRLATAALAALRGSRAPLAGQHTTDEYGCPDAMHHGVDCPGDRCRHAEDSDTADELAAAGLRACCGQPSERHCQ